MNKHSESEKVVADVQRKRPEPKPNISETHEKFMLKQERKDQRRKDVK
jgi:hypothetical protein